MSACVFGPLLSGPVFSVAPRQMMMMMMIIIIIIIIIIIMIIIIIIIVVVVVITITKYFVQSHTKGKQMEIKSI